MPQYKYDPPFCNGEELELKTADEEKYIYVRSKACTITKLIAQVTEAVMCANTQAKIDVGVLGDDDVYIDAFEIPDNALVGTMIDLTSSLLITGLSASVPLVGSVNQAALEGGSEQGKVKFIIETECQFHT